MTALLFLLCFLVAVLSGLGVGGGGLLAVILSLFSDLPALTVQGINLYFFLFSGAAALLVHLVRRRISAGTVLIGLLFGTAGTLLGSGLAHTLGDGVTRRLFGLFLIPVGTVSLIRCIRQRKKEKKS